MKAVHSYKCGKKWQKLSYVQVMELCAGHHKNNNNDNKNEDNEKHLQQQQQQSCTSITTKISLWLLRSNTKYFPMVRGCCFWWQKWSTMVKADRWVQKITQGEKKNKTKKPLEPFERSFADQQKWLVVKRAKDLPSYKKARTVKKVKKAVKVKCTGCDKSFGRQQAQLFFVLLQR